MPEVQAGFRKGCDTSDHIAINAGSWKNLKIIKRTSALLAVRKPSIVLIVSSCGEPQKIWGRQQIWGTWCSLYTNEEAIVKILYGDTDGVKIERGVHMDKNGRIL